MGLWNIDSLVVHQNPRQGSRKMPGDGLYILSGIVVLVHTVELALRIRCEGSPVILGAWGRAL